MLIWLYRSALALSLTVGGASAATVAVSVTDTQGRPVSDAVVSLSPVGDAHVASHVPEKGIIAQRNETFIPLVAVVRRGGTITFTNNDTTSHQVYSFSPIKQFAFEIDQGQVAAPVVFPEAGLAVIGCNIHDQMIAYVDVTDEPFAAVTDAHGHAEMKDVPAGQYQAKLWHPRLPPGRPAPSISLNVGGAPAQIALTTSLLPERRMMNMRMDY